MRQLKVFIASKVRHAEMLRGLRTTINSDGIHFNARWLETVNLPYNSTKPVSHWQQENLDDINSADAVFVYAERGEHLKGALFELGYAYAYGKPIYLVGQTVTPGVDGTKTEFHADFEPWSRVNPQQIFRANDFQEAVDALKQLEKARTKG